VRRDVHDRRARRRPPGESPRLSRHEHHARLEPDLCFPPDGSLRVHARQLVRGPLHHLAGRRRTRDAQGAARRSAVTARPRRALRRSRRATPHTAARRANRERRLARARARRVHVLPDGDGRRQAARTSVLHAGARRAATRKPLPPPGRGRRFERHLVAIRVLPVRPVFDRAPEVERVVVRTHRHAPRRRELAARLVRRRGTRGLRLRADMDARARRIVIASTLRSTSGCRYRRPAPRVRAAPTNAVARGTDHLRSSGWGRVS
jgi:hypothetical protein